MPLFFEVKDDLNPALGGNFNVGDFILRNTSGDGSVRIGNYVLNAGEALTGKDGYALALDEAEGRVKLTPLGDMSNPFDQDLNTTDSPSFVGLDLAGGTVTTSTPTLGMSQTTDNGAVDFVAAYMNLTNTASNSLKALKIDVDTTEFFALRDRGVFGVGIETSESYLSFYQNNNVHMLVGTNRIKMYKDLRFNAGVEIGVAVGDSENPTNAYIKDLLTVGDGTYAGTFDNYNSYTDASNYERFRQYWDTNVAVLKTEADGTGTVRDFHLGTDGGGAVDFSESGSIIWSVVGVGGSAKMSLNNSRLELYADIDPNSSGTRILGRTDRWARANLGGNTVTDSTPVLDVAQTVNEGSTDFSIVSVDVTNTASNSINLLDLQVDSASQFVLDGDGNVQFGGTLVHVNDNDVEYKMTATGWHRWYRQDGDHNMLLHPANGLQIKGDYGFGFTSTLNGSDSDVKIWREAAGNLALRNGTNDQRIDIFNSYTNASNNEGFRIDWQTVSNLCIIGTFNNGTGATRDIDLFRGGTRAVRWLSGSTKLYGHLKFNGISLDIGESVTLSAPRNIWAQGKVEAPALALVDVSADPADPANGQSIMWQSDGTGSGNDGDIMMKITDSGGTTKTVTLIDYSAA